MKPKPALCCICHFLYSNQKLKRNSNSTSNRLWPNCVLLNWIRISVFLGIWRRKRGREFVYFTSKQSQWSLWWTFHTWNNGEQKRRRIQGYRNRYKILLINKVEAVFFVIFFINSLNLSTNLNCCLVQHNGSCCFIRDIYSIYKYLKGKQSTSVPLFKKHQSYHV